MAGHIKVRFEFKDETNSGKESQIEEREVRINQFYWPAEYNSQRAVSCSQDEYVASFKKLTRAAWEDVQDWMSHFPVCAGSENNSTNCNFFLASTFGTLVDWYGILRYRTFPPHPRRRIRARRTFRGSFLRERPRASSSNAVDLDMKTAWRWVLVYIFSFAY